MQFYSKVIMLSSLPFCAFLLWKYFSKQTKVYSKRRKHFIPGLVNTGNTCFMNALLQCLSSLPSLTSWLDHLCRVCLIKGNILLAETLLKILLSLHGNSGEDYLDPSFLLNHLSSCGWYISSQEHDTHEFFHCIMTTFDDEFQYVISRYLLPNLNIILEISDFELNTFMIKRQKYNQILMERVKTRNKRPFHGLLDVRLRCLQCGHSSPVKFESFHSLSLSIEHIPTNTLLDCLRRFLSNEILNNVYCKSCAEKRANLQSKISNDVKSFSKRPLHEKSRSVHSTLTLKNMVQKFLSPTIKFEPKECTMHDSLTTSSFIKMSNISKYPQCLCIHLKRLVWHRGQPVKLNQHIKYPEILDLGEFKYRFKNFKKNILSSCNPIFMSLVKSRPETGDAFVKDRLLKIANHEFPKERNCKLKRSLGLYQLTGVIIHLGDWNSSGHFIAYRRHVLHDRNGKLSVQWFYTSDLAVRKVTLKEVLNKSAYMLFYEKLY